MLESAPIETFFFAGTKVKMQTAPRFNGAATSVPALLLVVESLLPNAKRTPNTKTDF